MEKPGTAVETEKARVAAERKKHLKEAAKENDSSSGHGSSSKKRGPYKQKGKEKRREVSAEEMKALGETYDNFMTVTRVLGDAAKSREEKETATTDYLQSAGKLVFLKYAWWLIEYSPEVNLAAAGTLWSGYRAKNWWEDLQAAKQKEAQSLLGQLGLGGGGTEEKK